MKNYHKTFAVTIVVLLLSVGTIVAQLNLNEKGFSFQGYAKNFDGAALSSKTIEVQFSIYPDGGPVAFSEVHTTDTDAFGVFHLVIGAVNSADFKKLDFIKVNNYKLKVETRVLGGTYATISDAQMQSVPYAQAADNGVPVGSMIIFAGPKANIPAGWLACDGTSVSATAYPKLFAAIGSSWGASGSNFNLPDMRGRFPRGVDNGKDLDPGRQVGSYQGGAVQGHSHDKGNLQIGTGGLHDHGIGRNGTINTGESEYGIMKISGNGTATSGDDAGNFIEPNVFGAYQLPAASNEAHGNHAHSISGSTANYGGNETRPVNAAVWYIIRAR